MKYKLIGSKTCPFVQRCLIMLLAKKASFETDFIDLTNKPDWFLRLSPTGKVPMLQVNNDFLFESSVINEYLDQIIQPELSLVSPLQRAIHKGWIEFGSSLLVSQYALSTTHDENTLVTLSDKLAAGLSWLESSNIQLPFFNGAELSLVDIAFAPLFIRLNLISTFYPLNIFSNKPAIEQWSLNLCAHPVVKESMTKDYESLIIKNIQSKQGIISKYIHA